VLASDTSTSLEIRSATDADWPTDAEADLRMDLDVLGSMYLGAHKASSYAGAKRLHTNDSGLLARLEAAFVSDVPAVLGYGF
jgi:predicted acetyltransferase